MGKLWVVLLMTLHTRIYHGSLGGQSHRVGSPLRHGTLQLVAVFHDYMRSLQQPEHGHATGRVRQMNALGLCGRGGQPVAKTEVDDLRPLPLLEKPWWSVYFHLKKELPRGWMKATNRFRYRKSMIIWVLMEVMDVGKIHKRKWAISWALLAPF